MAVAAVQVLGLEIAPLPWRADSGEGHRLTLLELVRAISEVTEDEEEIVATAVHMLRSGSVRLCGNFRDESIDRF
jgi:hypothetical protein